MLARGLIDEVRKFRGQGYGLDNNAMQALGYKQVIYYLEGLMSYEEMVEAIKKGTRRFAKRQYTWFKRDERIKWFDVSQDSQEALVEKIYIYMAGLFSRA